MDCVTVKGNKKEYTKEEVVDTIGSFLHSYEESDDMWDALEKFPCEYASLRYMLKGDLLKQLIQSKSQPDPIENPYPLIFFKGDAETYLILFEKLCIYHHYHGVFQKNNEIKHYDVFYDSVAQLLKFIKKN